MLCLAWSVGVLLASLNFPCFTKPSGPLPRTQEPVTGQYRESVGSKFTP